MNKVLLAVGLLSAGVAFGQTTRTTKSSSTTTSSSNYNNTNTNNYNSNNATTGSNSGTSGSMSTGTTGTSGTYNNSTGTYNSGTTNGSTGSGTTGTGTMGTGSMGTGSTGTTGTYNSNGTYNNSTTVTPSGSSNYNTMGTSGATTTTPSTTYDSNNTGTNATGTSAAGTSSYNSTNTYSTQTTTTTSPRATKDYKNFAYGIYAGLNTTKFKGEALDANGNATALTGRLGYQIGFFVRGGGRLYGQLGAEYFASSSNYFTAGQGQSVASIADQINIKYIQVPVYVGYKLTESDRGISAVRVQVGLEYANQIGSTANQFGNLNNFEIKRGTFNGVGQLGFDAGPLFLDLTYHYGFSNAIQQNTGFAGSQRRILSASLGFKF